MDQVLENQGLADLWGGNPWKGEKISAENMVVEAADLLGHA